MQASPVMNSMLLPKDGGSQAAILSAQGRKNTVTLRSDPTVSGARIGVEQNRKVGAGRG